MTDLNRRKKILQTIGKELKKSLKGNIVSATVYGSTLLEDYCSLSDLDVLLILKIASSRSLEILRNIKERYKCDGIDVDFNVHTMSEIPRVRGATFWHNNRSLYIQIELFLYGKQLLGENLIGNRNVAVRDLQLEVVRVISSLNYQARKLLVNSNLSNKDRITMMKWCIYGVMYYLAFWNVYIRPDHY
ncbi:MAG: nucleotidyltransferase domain-containing protein [Candidatus Taylorbacteria bacterium]